MQVCETVSSLRKIVSDWRQAGLKVGFVPTMGNLHAGHISLVKLAQQSCDKVIVSIFVNPLQFGPNEDFDRYPRTLTSDQEKLQQVYTDCLFYPHVDEMYPHGTEQTQVKVPADLTGLLEGAKRPGHFDGVTTVVNKLFNMVQPDIAVFGQKDYQQLAVLKKMVADLAIPIEIITAPISRDVDGLALSSRNQYLNPEQRQIAPKLNTVLKDIEAAILSGNSHYSELCNTASEQLKTEGFDSVDYIQVCHAITLEPQTLGVPFDSSQDEQNSLSNPLVILAVARLGQTRLLDNILLENR